MPATANQFMHAMQAAFDSSTSQCLQLFPRSFPAHFLTRPPAPLLPFPPLPPNPIQPDSTRSGTLQLCRADGSTTLNTLNAAATRGLVDALIHMRVIVGRSVDECLDTVTPATATTAAAPTGTIDTQSKLIALSKQCQFVSTALFMFVYCSWTAPRLYLVVHSFSTNFNYLVSKFVQYPRHRHRLRPFTRRTGLTRFRTT